MTTPTRSATLRRGAPKSCKRRPTSSSRPRGPPGRLTDRERGGDARGGAVALRVGGGVAAVGAALIKRPPPLLHHGRHQAPQPADLVAVRAHRPDPQRLEQHPALAFPVRAV